MRAFEPSGALAWWLVVSGLRASKLGAQYMEGSFTVPAGEWLVESDVAAWLRDGVGGDQALDPAMVLVSVGLGERWNVQAGFEGWQCLDFAEAGRGAGYQHGEPYLRTKCFAAEDGQKWGLAVIPGLVLPTGRNDAGKRDVRWSWPVPVSWSWQPEWTVDFQVGSAWTMEDTATTVWGASGALHRGWENGGWIYGECLTEWAAGEFSERVTSVDMGVARLIGSQLEVEEGVYTSANDLFSSYTVVLRLSWSGARREPFSL